MADAWLATLAEVRRQAARVAAIAGVQPPETDGTWYDVAAGRVETSDLETLDESGAWRGLQWLNAFEVLVHPSFPLPSRLLSLVNAQTFSMCLLICHSNACDGAAVL